MNYSKTEIRTKAKNIGIKNPAKYSKKTLCEKLGITHVNGPRDGYEHFITNMETGSTEIFKSVGAIGKKFFINTGTIFNRIKTQKPLFLNETKFLVAKVMKD